MTRLTPEHFEVIDKNKAKAYEDRKQMRDEVDAAVKDGWMKTTDEAKNGAAKPKRGRKPKAKEE